MKLRSECLILKRWIDNSKEKTKDICDKNKDLIEYHKNDVTECRKCHLRETKFAKFSGGAYPEAPLEARALDAHVSAFSAKNTIISLFSFKKGLESLLDTGSEN